MLTITLTFKSIEAARAALLEIPSSSLVGGDTVEVEAPKAKTKAKDVAAPVASASAPSTTPKPEPEATTSSAKPSESAVDYPTLQKAVFALAGKSRDAAAAVAASFGVKTFKELPEAKWAEALAAVQTATASA